MKLDMAVVGAWMQAIQSEIQIVSATLRDKGRKRFDRPLVTGLALVAGSYYLLYMPPQQKLSTLERRIETARATATNADTYKELRDQLRSIYAVLPKPKDKDRFLTEAVIETLKAEGLVSESIKPPDEQVQDSLAFQKVLVTAEVPFTSLVAWLARLEASKPFLHVNSLTLQKSKNPGQASITVGLSTIVPIQDMTR